MVFFTLFLFFFAFFPQNEGFLFLDNAKLQQADSVSFPDMRLRTKFYSALTRLLLARTNDYEECFERYLSPMKGDPM